MEIPMKRDIPITMIKSVRPLQNGDFNDPQAAVIGP
jgi:hypothetical protein